MNEILITLFSCALLNNLVMTHLVGLDLQLVASQRMQAAWNTGATTLVSLCILIPTAKVLDVLILVPLQLQHFTVLVYVAMTVLIITALQRAFYFMFPQHKENFNSVVPLLLTNNLFLAAMLLQQTGSKDFFMLCVMALAYGLGFLLLLLLITSMRERIDHNKVPRHFRGIPILLFSLGIFSMGLMGLTGIK